MIYFSLIFVFILIFVAPIISLFLTIIKDIKEGEFEGNFDYAFGPFDGNKIKYFAPLMMPIIFTSFAVYLFGFALRFW